MTTATMDQEKSTWVTYSEFVSKVMFTKRFLINLHWIRINYIRVHIRTKDFGHQAPSMISEVICPLKLFLNTKYLNQIIHSDQKFPMSLTLDSTSPPVVAFCKFVYHIVAGLSLSKHPAGGLIHFLSGWMSPV